MRRIAASTLGLVMGGHVLLETATDALFLANVSVERLPFVTIAIAVVALLATQGPAGSANRSALIALQAVATLGTVGLWGMTVAGQAWAYYALYIWSGVITSVLVVRFWLLLAELFTIIEGKRLYASIGMGGSIGALLGSALAAAIAPFVGGGGLLLAASAIFAVSGMVPWLLDPGSASSESQLELDTADDTGLLASLHGLLESPYAARIAGLVMIGGITLTLGDYLFKSVLTEEVEPDQLAIWLSRINFTLNSFSILMLGVFVTPVVRKLGVDRSLAVLPALLALAGLGVLAGGALVATIFLKVSDGTLRYSLHRTATELLYLPMKSSLRTLVKGAIDIVGNAGAKALGSLVILVLVMWPDPRMVVAGAVVAAASVWLVAALSLRAIYLDVFRETLSQGAIETAIDYPELDLESAGSLIRALAEPDERRVIAAMRILVERGHAGLIPGLIVYHPSARVVTHALDIFAASGREEIRGVLDLLLDHADSYVRAAAVRFTWGIDHDISRLRHLQDSDCLAIRVSAVAGLLAHDEIEEEVCRATFAEALDYPDPGPRIALAAAARLSYRPAAREALLQLVCDEDREVSGEAIRAIRESEDDWFIGPLVDLLGERHIRDGVRCALIGWGDDALRVLAARLVDPETPVPVLRHIPRTIARFASPAAARVLLDSFQYIDSGLVRFKLLRALEALMLRKGPGKGTDPEIAAAIDRRQIEAGLQRTLDGALTLLQHEAGLASDPIGSGVRMPEDPAGGDLLRELLEDKRTLTTERVFMILGLLYPNEDFQGILAGFGSTSPADRASAQELIESLLPRDTANAVIALASEGDPATRLALADPVRKESLEGYAETVRVLLEHQSRSVRAIALYHAGEICLDCAVEDLPAGGGGEPGASGQAATLQDRAIGLLRNLSEGPVRRSRPLLTSILAR